ncbi:MAG: energy-coupling factor transporter transmembrane protein EcfT [Eggerthellaceae bacterium]|nr:energy-coupling factor transporter transmembrane protein EcfT [Eggerthellaceae bacterium]
MTQSALFGRYWPGESPIHALDPRTKLTGVVLAMVAIFLAHTYAALGVAALFVAAFFIIARIPPVQAFKSIAPLFFIVLLTAFLNLFFVQSGEVYAQAGPFVISQGGIDSAIFLCIRLTLLLLVASLLTLTTTSLDLTDAFEAMLSPFARFGFPAHEFAMVMGIALRFLPQFMEELRTIRAAQLSRGAHVSANPFHGGLSGLSSLMVPLFTSAFRHAETLSNGMDARCYHGGVGRTRLHPLSFTSRDLVAALVLLALIVACVLVARFTS